MYLQEVHRVIYRLSTECVSRGKNGCYFFVIENLCFCCEERDVYFFL